MFQTMQNKFQNFLFERSKTLYWRWYLCITISK